MATTDFTFDQAGRLTGMAHAQGATSLVNHSWQFDAANRLTQYVNSIDGTVDYAHDDRDQLIGADYDYQADESYTYDENGNRTNTGYATGGNNQLLSDGVFDYEYDAEGNRTRKTNIATGAVEVCEWDHRNRLVKITEYANETDADNERNSLEVVTQTYDAFNQWTSRTVDPDGDSGTTAVEKTFFLYENGQINLQFDKTGSSDATASDLSHRYLWSDAVDQLLADENASNEILWSLTDHLGTTRDLAEYDVTTDTTTIASHRTFNAFGELTSETGTTTIIFGFTGRVFDITTGLQNNLNRWYDFHTGRWVSEDPIGFAGGVANLGSYVFNSPTLLSDPLGLIDFGGAAFAIRSGFFYMQPFTNGPGAYPIYGIQAERVRDNAHVAAVTSNIRSTILTEAFNKARGTGLAEGHMSYWVEGEIKTRIPDDTAVGWILSTGELFWSGKVTVTWSTNCDGVTRYSASVDLHNTWSDEIDANSRKENPALENAGIGGFLELKVNDYLEESRIGRYLGFSYRVKYIWSESESRNFSSPPPAGWVSPNSGFNIDSRSIETHSCIQDSSEPEFNYRNLRSYFP